MALFQEEDELLEEVPHTRCFGAGYLDLVASDVDLDAFEGGLDHSQQLVPVAQEIGHEMVAWY